MHPSYTAALFKKQALKPYLAKIAALEDGSHGGKAVENASTCYWGSGEMDGCEVSDMFFCLFPTCKTIHVACTFTTMPLII